MNSGRRQEDYLHDILEYAKKAERFLAGLPSAEDLRKDERTLLAVIRCLEVIGEAAKRVPSDLRRKHPGVPWRGMMGMRDKVIHGYFGVDAEVVWRTVREDLPLLRKAMVGLME
ncbi:DUF86 domain-containing protein [Candidatus Bipolaricaulota bacterium]|nr:DUF86 domain-containing protein [Candidatus Bipolaricaulota bacterium]